MKSEFDFSADRRHFVKTATLTTGTLMAGPFFPQSTRSPDIDYDYMDMHVHTAPSFGMDRIMQISQEKRVKFGIVEHPGRNSRIRNDVDLQNYIKGLRQYPVYIGL